MHSLKAICVVRFRFQNESESTLSDTPSFNRPYSDTLEAFQTLARKAKLLKTVSSSERFSVILFWPLNASSNPVCNPPILVEKFMTSGPPLYKHYQPKA